MNRQQQEIAVQLDGLPISQSVEYGLNDWNGLDVTERGATWRVRVSIEEPGEAHYEIHAFDGHLVESTVRLSNVSTAVVVGVILALAKDAR